MAQVSRANSGASSLSKCSREAHRGCEPPGVAASSTARTTRAGRRTYLRACDGEASPPKNAMRNAREYCTVCILGWPTGVSPPGLVGSCAGSSLREEAGEATQAPLPAPSGELGGRAKVLWPELGGRTQVAPATGVAVVVAGMPGVVGG